MGVEKRLLAGETITRTKLNSPENITGDVWTLLHLHKNLLNANIFKTEQYTALCAIANKSPRGPQFQLVNVAEHGQIYEADKYQTIKTGYAIVLIRGIKGPN